MGIGDHTKYTCVNLLDSSTINFLYMFACFVSFIQPEAISSSVVCYFILISPAVWIHSKSSRSITSYLPPQDGSHLLPCICRRHSSHRKQQSLHFITSSQLTSTFKMLDHGRLSYFLGIKVISLPNVIHLNQVENALKILHRICMSNCKLIFNPTTTKPPISTSDILPYSNHQVYWQLVDALQYLTRHVMSFFIKHLCQHLQTHELAFSITKVCSSLCHSYLFIWPTRLTTKAYLTCLHS